MTAVCPLVGRPTQTEPTPFERNGFRLVRCVETGFVYMANPPAYEAVRDDFPWEETIKAERERRRREEPLVSRVSDAVKFVRRQVSPGRNHAFRLAAKVAASTPRHEPLRLLDVGCGSGILAVDCCKRFTAAGRDITPIGLELSTNLAKAASRRFAPWSGDVIAAPALEGVEQIEDQSVHIATLISFLEHDPKPLELLRALRPKLAPTGAVVVKVPNFASLNRRLRGKRWCGFRYPDHVNYFTPRTLRILAEEAGYSADVGSRTDRPLLSDNMYAVLRPAA